MVFALHCSRWLTNWCAFFIIVVAGHLTDMQHHLVTDEHYSFGWYMFAGMMADLLPHRAALAGSAGTGGADCAG